MSRRGENIYKRKDGRWEGRYIKGHSSDGKPIYGYIYTRNYREAREKLASAKTRYLNHSEPTSTPTKSVHLHEWARLWLTYKANTIKLSSYNKYELVIQNYILPYLGDKDPARLNQYDIENYSKFLLAHGRKNGCGLSSKTITDVMNILDNILKYAADHEYPIKLNRSSIRIHQNASDIIIISKFDQKKLTDYLQSNLSLKNLGILLCLFTGLRIGEMCALTWADISLVDQKLTVNKTMQRLYEAEHFSDSTISDTNNLSNHKTFISITSPKSACSIRTIPLPEQLVAILGKYESSQGYVLTGQTDSYIEPRSYRNHFKKVLRECEIEDVHFHALRHTFATRCIELGFDVKTLSEILGHSSVNITMNRYVHPTMDMKQENMEKLNALL